MLKNQSEAWREKNISWRKIVWRAVSLFFENWVARVDPAEAPDVKVMKNVLAFIAHRNFSSRARTHDTKAPRFLLCAVVERYGQNIRVETCSLSLCVD